MDPDQTVPSGACPGPEILEAVAAGMTVEPEISRHLSGCRRCSLKLAALREANDLLEEATTIGGVVSGGPAEVRGYQLKREIHRGGQGVVWLAEQEGTRREVAIKMLLAGRFATSRQRRRFEREIEVVASLDHPSIVTVFESGVTGDDQIYCAMEYVEGLALDAWSRESGATVPVVVSMMERIAEAVATAHRRGVIHRDLKPANVLVDVSGSPHVLDFGLARLENERDSERAELLATEAGEFLGTFIYAAPEQLSADPSSVDTRADVYALGLLLFELIAGERPFPRPESVADLVTMRVEAHAPRLSTRARGVGRELDLIVARALDPDPERRYETAGDFADDLRRLGDGRPVRARGDSLGYLVLKSIQRHRLTAAFMATIAVLVVGSTIALFLLYTQSEGRRRQAERVESAIVGAFRYLNPQDLGTMDMSTPDLIARLEESAEETLGNEPLVQARVLRLAGDSFCNLELFDDAERCFLKVAGLQATLAQGMGMEATTGTASADHDLGRIAWFRGANALRLAKDARSAGRTSEADSHADEFEGRMRDAEQIYRRALAARRSIPEVSPEELSMTLQHLSAVVQASSRGRSDEVVESRLDEAQRLLEEALAIRLRIQPVPRELLATTWNSLARIQSARGMTAAAIEAARKAVDLVMDDSSPRAWQGNAQVALGGFLMDGGRPEEAADALEKGLGICVAVFGERSPRVRRIRRDLGEAELLAGDPERTLQLVAVPLDDADLDSSDPVRVALAFLKVDALVRLGRRGDAVESIDEFVANTPGASGDVRWMRRRERLADDARMERSPRAALDDLIDERWGMSGE